MNQTSTLLLGLALAVIMLGMGLSLVTDDFKRIFQKPKAVILGLVLQIVVLPLVAFGISYALILPPFIALGLVILSACPGGPTSNLITHLAKGDTALSVTLTAVSSFLTIITIPFIINLGSSVFYSSETEILLDIPDTIKKILIVSIVPIILGMLIRRYFPKFADKMAKPTKISSATILIVMIVGIVVKERNNVVEYFTQAGSAALLLNGITMILGFLAARLFSLNVAQSKSIAIETGIQNGTMAITIAVGIMGRVDLSIAAGVYSLIMFFTSGILIFLFNKKTENSSSDSVELMN
ncbi:bile acid:sodium symporter family protein [Flammeovirga kamogawensis]|uniref:Bile acid:sodium symporter family protein n=1 Tax=Flammeovirga kamogawensis TaxID=373891 RepID=A0ABX8GVV1_9BACT|nr:bile acid:sodium symporter family protein [Flammeovirga kamogawensis]MBB6461159.1 BASS family bile acid:Na+ symporter [Flammeovirga kamogawensis]QWG07725.1 bile acid:sodium symporter family protein [Flammeovirga kamogawensis]TRX69531.1 bile acid:sodium symporter family protein [Flammeovirga kamogawensis]